MSSGSPLLDNITAFRIIAILVNPFTESDAYKLGIIDADGNNLIKYKNLKTSEQKEAYTYLHRLTFNIKKLINKLPGGESKLKNIVSAYHLVKEVYATQGEHVTEQMLYEQYLKDLPLNHRNTILMIEEIAANNASSGSVSGLNSNDVAVKTDLKKYLIKRNRFKKYPV